MGGQAGFDLLAVVRFAPIEFQRDRVGPADPALLQQPVAEFAVRYDEQPARARRRIPDHELVRPGAGSGRDDRVEALAADPLKMARSSPEKGTEALAAMRKKRFPDRIERRGKQMGDGRNQFKTSHFVHLATASAHRLRIGGRSATIG